MFYETALPFVGFGFLDNAIMILAVSFNSYAMHALTLHGDLYRCTSGFVMEARIVYMYVEASIHYTVVAIVLFKNTCRTANG